MHKHSLIKVAKDFSPFPAGRFKSEQVNSGEGFRELLVTKLKENDTVHVLLDGTMGFGSNWLEEAFGGLVIKDNFTAEVLHKKLTVTSSEDKSLVMEIWSYIDKGAG